MKKMEYIPELLAPAGNLEIAAAAFDAGADAVYCGLGRFNARERAANFTAEELGRLIGSARARGRRVYLTLNTLLKENELPQVVEYLAELSTLKPDALIVQDLALVFLVRRYFPGLVLHASTQMGIHNSAGVKAAAALGFRRVILERQLSMEELRSIAADSPLELEVFVHGSLCCSLSGRCLLSSSQGGWSGNRGKCRQPCRRRFEGGGRTGFLLSPRDLYGVELLPELRRIGVASLKIEGRLRSPDYVWKTVRAYRLLLDGPVDPPPERLEEAERLLRSTATRRPSSGFFRRKEWPNLIDADRIGAFGNAVARVERSSGAGLRVQTLERLHLGDRLRLVPPEGGDGESFSLTSLVLDGRDVVRVRSGVRCLIPGEHPAGTGWLLCKIGENGFDFTRQAAAFPPVRHPVAVELRLDAECWRGKVAGVEEEWRNPVEFAPARERAFSREDALREFSSGVPEPWRAEPLTVEISGAFFVPASRCKQLRREFWNWAAARLRPDSIRDAGVGAMARFYFDYRKRPGGEAGVSPAVPGDGIFQVPAFLPEGELAKTAAAIREAYRRGVRRFRIGGLHAFELLRGLEDLEIETEFPLPVSNSLAAELLRDLGVCRVEAEPELDAAALAEFCGRSPLPVTERARETPLLVTRLPLPAGEWRDGRGNRFRVERRGGLSQLFAGEETGSDLPAGVRPFRLNGWK